MRSNLKENINQIEQEERFSFKLVLKTLGSIISGSSAQQKEKKEVLEDVEKVKAEENSSNIADLEKMIKTHGERRKSQKKHIENRTNTNSITAKQREKQKTDSEKENKDYQRE